MSREDSSYGDFAASELFCPRCKTARPVRQHLLLVLPTGNTYEFRCAVCGEVVGDKTDNDSSLFRDTLSSDLRR